MECEASGDSNSDDNTHDEGDGNITDLIDDDTRITTDISMYHRLRPSSSPLPLHAKFQPTIRMIVATVAMMTKKTAISSRVL